MSVAVGTTIAGYTILRRLGSGGMAEVYLAQHPRLPRHDALKIISEAITADTDFRERFHREAELAATLWHPHIVGVHDRGEFKDHLWISMDFVEGTDAAQLMKGQYRTGMPPKDVCAIVSAVADALDYAHHRGLLHRDVKPANILLAEPDEDGKRRIMLADFGIARPIADISGLTATNFTVGTLTYAAPEQLMGADIDGRADQYALAATAFHLLAGTPPYQHSNPVAVISQHLNATPPKLSDRRPELAHLDQVLSKALAKNPTHRFDRCRDFATKLSERAVVDAESDRDTEAGPTVAAPPAGSKTPTAVGRPRDKSAQSGRHSPTPQSTATKSPPRPKESRPSGTEPTAAKEKRHRRPRILLGAAIAVVAFTVIGAIAWIGLSTTQSEKPPAPTNPSSTPDAAARPACGDPSAILASMPTRDKLAQLLMVGVKNAADARAVVANHHVGGINIASWTDLSMLTDGSVKNLAASTALPVAISVDEEGGRVARLSSLIGPAPSARVLAKTHTVDEVYGIALDRGHEMRALGITIDFAPVVDVSDAPDDTVIGDRSFSSDPAVVTAYAGAYARGLRDAGLVPVLKHFPGYGRVSGDSHDGAVTTPPLNELQNSDLVPYRTLLPQEPVGVMIGHLQVPGLTGDQPASLSRAAVQLLRTGTGYNGPAFDGPVFTDDLFFTRAINNHYSVPDAVLRALQAGADNALSLSTDGVPAVLDRLEKALAAGELTMSAVDASVLRMAKVKGPKPDCGP